MGAAGLSPLRLLRVPLVLSLVVAALGLWLALVLEPAGMRAARSLMNDIVRKNVSSEVRAGTFYEQIPGFTLYAERVDEHGWTDVLIHDRSNPDAPVLSLARHGRLEPVGQGQDMRLALEEGELHREEAQLRRLRRGRLRPGRAGAGAGRGAGLAGRGPGPERPGADPGRDPRADRRRLRPRRPQGRLAHRGQPAPPGRRGPGGHRLRAAGRAARRLALGRPRLRGRGDAARHGGSTTSCCAAGRSWCEGGTSRPGWASSWATWWWPRWGWCCSSGLARRGTGAVR